MGPVDKEQEQNDNNGNSAQENLRAITEELEHLKRNLIIQLSQEIEQLQNRKTRLLAETEQLELQRQEQLAAQEQIANQIAPAIAEQVLQVFKNYLPPSASDVNNPVYSSELNQYNENAYRLIASLDMTLRTTFRTLQQDLSSYKSSLSQQLGQMYTLEQQGEAILDNLVGRLQEELKREAIPKLNSSPTSQLPPSSNPMVEGINPLNTTETRSPLQLPTTDNLPNTGRSTPTPPKILTPPQPTPPPRPAQKTTPSKLQLGFILVSLSSLALSLMNVIISIILNKSSLFFGLISTGGYLSPGVGNSLLILFMRMVVVVPLMMVLAQILYPSSGEAIAKFIKAKNYKDYLTVIGCGFFLFVSSVLIYMALGPLNPGVALTIFFIFPIITVLLSWLFFGDRPSAVRTIATITVFLGVLMIAFPAPGSSIQLSLVGVLSALGAGTTFALHVLLIQACVKKIHPVPFSVVNFTVILAFASLPVIPQAIEGLFGLSLPLPSLIRIDVEPTMWFNVMISGFVVGGLTLLSYLANNIGISYIGAARASIIGASGPALTSLLALIIKGQSMRWIQVLGMLIVTAGVLGQNLERMYKNQSKTKKTNNRNENGKNS